MFARNVVLVALFCSLVLELLGRGGRVRLRPQTPPRRATPRRRNAYIPRIEEGRFADDPDLEALPSGRRAAAAVGRQSSRDRGSASVRLIGAELTTRSGDVSLSASPASRLTM
jgi:hypothetical protein